MEELPQKIRIGAVVWALALGVVAILFAGTVMLPSTKKGHFHFVPPQTQSTDDAPTTQP